MYSARVLACVDLPALPLQLVWQAEPPLRAQPVVVVDGLRPQGTVLWACERARGHGVLAGQRYSQALSLCRAVVARVTAPEAITRAVTQLHGLLLQYSPGVEVVTDVASVLRGRHGASGQRASSPKGRSRRTTTRVSQPGGASAGSGKRVHTVHGVSAAEALAAFAATAKPTGATVVGAAGPAVGAAAEVIAAQPQAHGAGALLGMRMDAPLALATAPGCFWLDGTGMARVFADAPAAKPGTTWGNAIYAAVAAAGFTPTVVVGTQRFATYAIAKACAARGHRAAVVMASPAAEQKAQAAVPLARLDVAPALRDALAKLGVATLGQLARLPQAGLAERFGAAAAALHQLAVAPTWDPVHAQRALAVPVEEMVFDDEQRDVEVLGFAVKGALDRLMRTLVARRWAVTTLYLELTLKHAVGQVSKHLEPLKPAAPSVDAAMLTRLLQLRLSGPHAPQTPVIAMRLWADVVAMSAAQLALFPQRPARDVHAGAAALARLRAEFGESAVLGLEPRAAHLPEARMAWVARTSMRLPQPQWVVAPIFVRRLFTRPLVLAPQRGRLRDDGWLLGNAVHGAVQQLYGPHVIAGAWWHARPTERDYYFAQMANGALLWVYYDRELRRWVWQGEVR